VKINLFSSITFSVLTALRDLGSETSSFIPLTFFNMKFNKNQFAIIERIKREGSLLYNLFPINNRTKYPIFFNKLIERINTLKTKYNIQGLFYIYENAELSRKEINKDLINKGGIYIWWCSITGLFYIGSAKSFVGKNGRLNEYFQKSRLELISKTPKI